MAKTKDRPVLSYGKGLIYIKMVALSIFLVAASRTLLTWGVWGLIIIIAIIALIVVSFYLLRRK